MALENSIGDICEKAEEGQAIAFSGEILEVGEPEDKGEGKWGRWIQQTIKIGEGHARIQYDRSLEKGDPIFVTAHEGERVKVKGAKFRKWDYKGKTYYAASGGKVLEPELTELYHAPAAGDGDKGGESAKSTPREKKLAPDYEAVAWGAALLMRDIFDLEPNTPNFSADYAVAVQAGIATAIIQASHSTGLDMTRLIARGQKERARRRKEAGGEEEPEQEAPEAEEEKTGEEQAEEDKRTVTEAELIALDDLRIKHDVPKESVAAQAAQRWQLKNPALMNVGQMRVLQEWMIGKGLLPEKEKNESKTKFPF